MTQENKNCELCKRRISELEKRAEILDVAIFKGDTRDRSIKDRVYGLEFTMLTVEKSINAIAQAMRDQNADKKKLMIVIWGGAITFLCSSILLLISNFIGR